MKKIIAIIGALLLSGFLMVTYSQSWKSSNILKGTDDITVIKTRIDSEGSVYVFGYFYGTLQPNTGDDLVSLGSRDYFLIKFLQTGEIDWIKQLGGPSLEYINGGIGIDSDDNVYISGGYRSYIKYSPADSLISTGGFDLFLAKYNSLGEMIWIRNTGEGAGNQRPTSLRVDINNDLILSGFFTDSISLNSDTTFYSTDGVDDYFYSKFEPTNGDLLWAKQIRAISNDNSGRLTSVAILDDAYVLSGFFADSIVIENDTIVAKSSLYDVHIIKTDLDGKPEWIRTINGNDYEYSFGVVNDPSGSIYLSGYYNSDSLSIQSSDTESIDYNSNNGSYDFMMAKYSSSGDLLWFKANGGKGEDKLFDAKFFKNEFVVSGHFSDTLNWGGIQLKTNGVNDADMFVGNLDADGNYRSSNNFAGRNNSWEEARAVFDDGENSYSVIRSNSDLLVLGEDIYTSSTGKFYVALGIIGCNPISIDQVITQNVATCYGDSTGAIQILTSGGFGAPWQYSIDNGLNYEPLAYFADLPAGDYPIVVIDAENCAQPGPTETVTQPEALSLELITEEFTGDSMVNIVVAAYGGTPPYTYTLQPNGIVQAFGDFGVKWSEPGYYIVEVNDIRNCGPVATDTLTTSSGIDLFAPGVKLYPNPTSGIITVEVPFQGSACTLEVLNLTGQVMLSQQVYSNGISINETIDLSDLSKGMYMIRVDGQTLKSGVVVN